MESINRREALRLGGAAVLGSLLAGCGSDEATVEPEGGESHAVSTPAEALERLKHGNARFVGGNAIHPQQGAKHRAGLAAGQHPFATVLSCVDSRVPPELVFDEGLGDLFVSRTAGQVIDKAVLGSIQFGVHELHIPLLVVLGHSNCGAVKATIEAVEKNAPASGTDIDALVTAIRPAVEKAKGDKPKDLLDASVTANVNAVTKQLGAAPLIATAIGEKKLIVIGARYDLATGAVAFLE